MKLWFEKGAWASPKAKKIAADISPKSVRSIAVIRHAAIGDMMVLRPFLIQARQFFPNAKITLSIIDTYSYGVPEDLIDRIHVVHKKIDGKKTSYVQRFKEIRELGEHDILFDMADTSLSGMISLLTNAKLKIGFPYHQSKNHLFYDIGLLRSDLVPEVETLLHFLHIFGAPKDEKLEYGYPYPGVQSKEKRIIYFMGASMAKKQWPQELFIELIRETAVRYPGYSHVLLAGVGTHEKVDDIFEACREVGNIAKTDALPLEQMMPYLADSELVVSNDTGIRNMAIAVQTKTVGIFFATVPYRYWPDREKHFAVYVSDGSMPKVDDVFSAIEICLEKK